MKRFIAQLDCIWRLRTDEREVLKRNGYYVYDLRSWDTGNGNTIEPRVVVNYEGSVITNFEITNWDINDEHGKVINDMYKWVEDNDIEERDFDSELENQIRKILGME